MSCVADFWGGFFFGWLAASILIAVLFSASACLRRADGGKQT